MIFEYLTLPHILYSVTVPWIFVIYWYFTEGRRQPPSTTVIWHWMVCVIVGYYSAYWVVTEETRELHGVNIMFIYIAFFLYSRMKMTPSTAYALTFLNMWTVDMARAQELVLIGEATYASYFYGVGGAGMFDALCIFPLLSAALVPYIYWRQK